MKIFRNLALIAFTASLFAQTASAMEFACAKIDGSGVGDFEFSEICLNDQYALLKTGSFESSHYLYSVKAEPSPASTMSSFSLVSQKPAANSWMAVGQPLSVMAFRRPGVDGLVATLLAQNGGVTIVGSPDNSESGQYIANKFTVREIPITL